MSLYQKFESGGRFGLSWHPFETDSGELGRGLSHWTGYFATDEAREYFLEARTYEDAMNVVARDLRQFQAALADCFTKSGRVRRKKLIALVEKAA